MKKIRAFTLAEVLLHSTKTTRHAELVSASHAGFTLAETLITLMIIGVVAVLVIPAFMNNINENAMARQRDVFSKKFTEGLRQMRVDGKLNQKYESTQAFVNEMKNYFKINGTCTSTDLAGCFPASSITGTYTDEKDTSKNNETVQEINSSFTPQTLDSEAYATYDNFVGINFADGVSVLLTVNKDCTGPAEGDTESSVTMCLGYIADVNGTKGPNKQGKDILTNMSLSKAAGNAFGLSFEIINNTAYASGACATGTDGEEVCNNAIDGTTYEASPSDFPSDAWAGADNFCKKLGGSLPSRSQLLEIANAIGYNQNNCKYYIDTDDEFLITECDQDVITASPLYQQLKSDADYFTLGTNELNDSGMTYRMKFWIGGVTPNDNQSRRVKQKTVICVSE